MDQVFRGVLVCAIAGLLAASEAGAATSYDAECRIEAVLSKRLKSPLDFIETPISTVMTAISEEYDIPIQFDTTALEAVAQSPETEVSITISNVTLRTALRLMLRNVADVTYVVDNEVLLITTEDESRSRPEIRVYRVEDLVRYSSGDHHGQVAPERVQALRRILVTNVEKESWSDNKTGEGELCVFADDLFVITQTRFVHEQIEEALVKLRHAAAGVDECSDSTSASVPAAVDDNGSDGDDGG